MKFPIQDTYQLYIGGDWQTSASGETREILSPLTGEKICRVSEANEFDVSAAVMSGKAAWPNWFMSGPRKRQAALMQAADRILEEAERFAWLETQNTGKPWRESLANVRTAVDRLRYYAGAIRVLEGNLQQVSSDVLSMNMREPLGVIGIIGAWNFPLNMFLGKIAPALAAGNAVVYKPAEHTPLSTLELARLLGEVLPAGLVNVVTGPGRTTGDALVNHPDIRKITITGSVETGRLVMAAAATSTKQVTLELGGKNAQIVFPDADLDNAAQGVLLGAFLNQGQVCTSGSRIFVHRSVKDALLKKVLELVPMLRCGDPYEKTTNVGCIVYREHLDRILAAIEKGRLEGTEVLTGGAVQDISGYPNGLFVQPTLFGETDNASTLATREIFGPVATTHVWDEEEEMLGLVNHLDYGLAAGIWTENLGTAHRTAQAVEAGRVWVNCYNLFPSGAAFGGTKASGFGREDSFETLLAFTQVKNVIIDNSRKHRTFY